MNRYKHILVISILFLLTPVLFAGAGKSKIDSLETLLNKAKSDTGKIVLFYNLAEEYFLLHKTKSFDFNQEARSLSLKLKDKTKEVLINREPKKFRKVIFK